MRLRGLGGFGLKTFHKALKLFALAVLIGLGLKQLTVTQFAFFQIVIEGTVVTRHGAAIDLHCNARNGAEQITVVRDKDEGAFKGLEEALQPFHGGQVEVVGGFVQEEQGWFRGEHARQFGTHTPTTREGGEGLLEIFSVIAQPTERLFDACFKGVTAHLFKTGVRVTQGLEGAFLLGGVSQRG